ncbi:MAG: lipid IV(A) 3-deoxy-D-manno-octulosonic acid transferase [Pseudomonadota bacterium]|nr:lipid IV(A) 3-deoxy-D-manno-octulosonic acid transferase [Pseudomonadota bacterium]
MNRRNWRIALYTLLLYLLAPFVFARLFIRGRKQSHYLKSPEQRLGYGYPSFNRPVIWIHAVSVGETRAALPLINALEKSYPEHTLLLTHMTAAGLETGKNLFNNRVIQTWLPYDLPFACRRFLKHFSPTFGLLLETEIWFNLINCAKTRHIPLYLINARLSEKSAEGYAHFQKLTREGLAALSGVIAQSEDDAKRLAKLGAKNPIIAGNIKFDINPPDGTDSLTHQFLSLIGKRRVWLAASTREGEERIILDTIRQLPEDILTIIVPRHPQRFDEVAALITASGFKIQLRSDCNNIEEKTRVWIGDSMGEMYGYYGVSDIALIGGSLLPFGGQNLIEATAMGTPVLLGPHTFNFNQVAKDAIQAGAAIKVEDISSLARAIIQLFDSPQQLKDMQIAARIFAKTHTGATQRIIEHLRQELS